MRYIAAAQLYWPMWLLFAYFDHSYMGMFAGVVLVLVAWRVIWFMEFGE